MKYSIDTLISRGRLHNLHCEDDLYVYENADLIIAAVFDGCSSGKDSHFASTMHKYMLNRICNDIYSVTAISDSYVIDGGKTVENILRVLNNSIWSLDYETDKEMLSTVVLLLIDKHTGSGHICVAGDGCFNRVYKGMDYFESVHDANGNAVWYMSTVRPGDFDKYFSNYCRHTDFTLSDTSEVSISTDGLESFVSQYGASKTEDAKRIFFNTHVYEEKYRNMPLQRLYNIVTKGKCTAIGNETILNGDDFTMIKIKIEKESDETE